MGMGIVVTEYLVWHYGASLRDLSLLWRDFLWFGYHFFSIPLLTRTLFSPIFRLQEKSAKTLDITGMLAAFTVTTLMRCAGLFIRAIVLAMGFVFEGALALLFFPVIALWLTLPLLAPLLIVVGIKLLF